MKSGWGEEEPDWNHMGSGLYQRKDGKGTVTRIGSHDWSAQADVGNGLQSVGIWRSGMEGRHFVNDALAKGKIPPPPEVTPGTLLEQVTEKIRRAGLSSSVTVRVRRGRADGVMLGANGVFDVAIVLNEWGMKAGQQSYQVFEGTSREPVSNHDDERWRYPQVGEKALNEAVAEAVKMVVARRVG